MIWDMTWYDSLKGIEPLHSLYWEIDVVTHGENTKS